MTPKKSKNSANNTAVATPQPVGKDTNRTLPERFMGWLKQRQVWGFLVSVVVMAVLAIAFFYPDNFAGNDLRQHDMVQGIANGQEAKAFHEATGETTRWTNSLFGGMPTFQISPSYPSTGLFSWVTSVYSLGLPSPSNILFIMMLGFMILMMAMKVRWEYGLLGAIGWGFSSYFIILIGAGHIWQFVTLAYIPPTIAGIMLAYRGRYLAGGALAAFFAMMQISANHVQMTYYFGFLILGLIIAFLVMAIRRKEMHAFWKSTAAVAIAAILAVCANLPNLYHTWRYAKESQRGGSELVDNNAESQKSAKEYITQYSYGCSELFTLFIPNVKGGATIRPAKGAYEFMTIDKLNAAKEFNNQALADYPGIKERELLKQFPQYFGEPEGTNGPVYAGALIFALFLLGCIIVKGPVKWTMLTLALLSAFLALGRNMMWLTDFFIDYVPLYKSFRTPESILVVTLFCLAVLGVMALYKLFTMPEEEYRRKLKWVYITFGLVMFVSLLGVLFPGIFGAATSEEERNYLLENFPDAYHHVEDLRLSMVKADCLRTFLITGFGLIVVLIPRFKTFGKHSRSGAVALLTLLVVIDLYTVDKRYISHDSFVEIKKSDSKQTLEPDAFDNAIIADAKQQGYVTYRVLDADAFGDARRSYFHQMIGGYHAAKIGRVDDLINAQLMLYPQVFDMLNARYIIYQGQLMPNDEACGNAWYVDEVAYVDGAKAELEALASLEYPEYSAVADKQFEGLLGTGNAVDPQTEKVTLKSYAPNRLVYEADSRNGGVAVFSEIYFPWGWKATIDGEEVPIGRVNYVLRALKVPAGHHEIVFTFDPASVHTTNAIATIAVILIYLACVAAIVLPSLRRRKQD